MTTPLPTWVSDDSPIADPHGHGERAVKFLKALKHPKSTAPGRSFQLARFWERITRRVYGDTDASGKRRIRTVVILLPRGARKTSIGAAWSLLHAFGPERVPRGECLVAASDQKQAGIAFEEALGIVEATPGLARVADLRASEKWMSYPKKGAKFEALSSDAGTQHGRTPNFALLDELHAHKKRDLWDVIRTGTVKVPGTLTVVITTAGRGQENVAHDVIDYARKVARGEIDDPATLPILFETDGDADWQDEVNWYRVNPGLSEGFPDIEGLRQLAREAASKPGDRDAFRQLHLNVWLDHSHSPFVDMATYDLGKAPLDDSALTGQPVFLAVDLSSVGDLTAIVAAWKRGDGYAVRPWFFCPKDNLAKRADLDRVPYPAWASEGHLTPTPGNVVDYGIVEAKVRELCRTLNVQEVAFDPHMAQGMMQRLREDGLPAVEMRQGWITMAPAIHELERAIVAGRFQHGGHPVLRWNFANVAVVKDDAGNRKFSKGRSTDRIDGAQAAAMAVGRAMHGESGQSVYETRPLLVL